MGDTSENETVELEEHLLVCERCRLRVSNTDEFVAAMRRASARIRESETAGGQSSGAWRNLVWVALAAVTVATLFTAVLTDSK